MVASTPDILTRLRPRTVGEIIDGAFRLYRRNFRTFFLIAAVVYLPVQIISFGIDIWLGRYTPLDFSTTSGSGTLAARSVVSQFDSLKTYLETFLGYFAQWALTVAIADVILDSRVTFGYAYGEVRRRLGAVLGLIGLQTLIAAGFFLPIILLVVVSLSAGTGGAASFGTAALGCLSIFSLFYFIIQVRLQIILPAAVNEELTPREALRRSWELTRNYWWRTFALSLVISILRSIVALGPGALLTGLAGIVFKLDYYTDLAVAQGIGIFTTVIYIPVEMGAIALYYYDQRVRKEGFDLDRAIAERYESGEAPEYTAYSETKTNAYPAYGAPMPDLPTAPTEQTSAANVPAGDVRQDHDLFPLLASGQHDRAMRTFRRRVEKIPHRKARMVSASPVKRKVPTFPKPVANPEIEQ
jgi:hypothetical protein